MSVTTLPAPIAQESICDAIAPSLDQTVCIHPHATMASRVYYFDALIAHKDHAERRQALVISPNSSKAAINKAVWAELGDRWYCTQYRVAA